MHSKLKNLFVFFAMAATTATTINAEKIDKLVITGNYTRHRLLAELIQWEKDNVPIILVSPTEHKNKFYYLPGTQPGEIPSAAEFSMNYLTDFLDQLDPQSVIVIGDEKIVGKNVVNELRDRKVLATVVDSTNWNTNVEKVQNLFRTQKIARPFYQITSKFYSLTEKKVANEKGVTEETLTEDIYENDPEVVLPESVEAPKTVPTEPEVKASVEPEVKVEAPTTKEDPKK